MTTCLLAIRDGRDEYHERSWASLREMLPPVEHTVVIDDHEHKLGFSGAVATGWEMALATGCTHVFHAELDFVYPRPIALHAMIAALDAHPHLVQMALLRGPVNSDEHKAGGVIEQHPADYETVHHNGHAWREHRRNVTTNPCVWPRWVVERGWPLIDQSEGHFGIDLFAEDPARRAAYWGTGVDVEHIGHIRSGTGY
jgi:hypothetical protein